MKMIPYGRQSIDQKDIEAVVAVLKSDMLTQGPAIDEFENNFLCEGTQFEKSLQSGKSFR